MESGESVVVGVNDHIMEEEPFADILRVDTSVREAQLQCLGDLRAKRDEGAVNRALAAVEVSAGTDDNMLPPIMVAVEAGVTLGEICTVLRDAWGEYRPPSIL
jgi:methylmalonyl-CoA mutase N-terminal domain/subunit